MCGHIQFARNSWLADCELDPERIDATLILVLVVEYKQLDNQFYRFEPAAYGKKDFYEMSDLLDIRKA